MFGFSSTKKSHDLKLIWRFDSAGVSATAFFTHTPTEIVYYHCQPLNFSAQDSLHTHQYHKLISRTQTVLGNMTSRFLQYVQRQPDSMEIVFGEPWSHISVRNISYKRKTKFRLTNALLGELVNRDIKNIKQRKTISAPDTNFSQPVYHRVSIAGHPVYEINGQSVNDVRLDYTIGNLNTDIATVVTKILKEIFHVTTKDIQVHHYQDLLINFFSQTDTMNGCIVDVSGYVTDMYIFQNGILKQWGTIPFGEMTMTEIISKRMDISLSEFSTLTKLYKRDLLSESMRQVMQSAFKKSIPVWTVDLQKFLSTATTDGMIIDQVFWIGNDSDPLLPLFVQTVQSDRIIFPQIFGTHQVGNTYGAVLFSAFAGYEEMKKQIIEDQDIIIKFVLS